MKLNAREAAYSLYDGGWRSDDRDELVRVYELTQDEADDVCAALKELEEVNA